MDILYARNTNFDFPEANKIQVVNMCKAFKENGCNVTLIAFGKNLQELEEKYNIPDHFKTILIKTKVRFLFQGEILLFLSFLKNGRKIQNIYTRDIVFAFLVKLFFKRKKVFLEIHDAPKKFWWKFIHRKIVPMLDRVIVISQGLKDGLSKLNINQEKIIILHDGVSLSQFDISISKEDARKELGLPQEKTIIIYAGSTKEDRDIPALIETAKKMPNICFVIFGKEQEYINKETNEISNFIFKGYTDHPELAYKAADILFAGYSKKVPTINYMSPLKIFEYMAAKRPIIVADFPRIREVLDENEVYFYEDDNSQDIITRIKEIIVNKNVSEIKALKAFSKVQNYTWKKRAEIIMNRLQDI